MLADAPARETLERQRTVFSLTTIPSSVRAWHC